MELPLTTNEPHPLSAVPSEGAQESSPVTEHRSTPAATMSRTLSDLYGTLSEYCPSIDDLHAAIAAQHLAESTRKYFDSGDYAIALSLTRGDGKGNHAKPIPIVGSQHPKPDTIPQSKLSISGGSIGACTKSSPIRDRVISAEDMESKSSRLFGTEAWSVTNNNQD